MARWRRRRLLQRAHSFRIGMHMTDIQQAAAASRAARVQKVACPSGIEVWLVEDYTVPLVAVDFAFTAGAAQDPEGKAGVTNMLAGLLDEGAGDLDADAFHRTLDEKAVELSFHATHDAFFGDMKTLTRHLDDAFALLALAVNEPRFDPDAVERVRSQVVAGLKRDARDPDAMVARAWRKASFPGHPYGRPMRGDLDSIPAIGRDDIIAMHKRILARGALRIAVVGAIDAQTLSRSVERTFGALPETGDVAPIADVTPVHGRREIVDVDVPQTSLRFSLPGIARHDDDYFAAIVLNHIIGGGVFSARLFKEVREKRGLAYSVWSQVQAHDHTAFFAGGTSTKNERAAESIAVIEEEIAKIIASGPTSSELDKAKKFLIGSYPLRFDTSTKIAGNLVQLQLDGRPVEFLDRRNDLIEAQTLDDMRRVGKRLFEGKQLLVVAAGRPVGF